MNFVGKKVTHKLFGQGKIVSQDDENHIIVRFANDDEKQFSAPKCFETFLQLTDASDQAEAKEQIEEQINKEKREAAVKQKKMWEHVLNNAAQKSGTTKQIITQSFSSLPEFFNVYQTDLEIEANHVRTMGGKRYHITDGVFVTFSGDARIYAFESDTELNLPDNIGITLWKDDQSFAATLVSCEDFNLTIATATDFGNKVSELDFSSEPWRLLYDLKDHLDEIRNSPSEIVRSLILKGRQKVDLSGAIRKGQELAVQMSHEQSILFVWGPPGTGKTETLATMALKHIALGERVLMLSYSNVSVDEAALRVLKKDQTKKPGKLVRYGYPRNKEVLTHPFLSTYNLCLMKHPELVAERQQIIEERKKLPKSSSQYMQLGKKLAAIRELLKNEEKQAVKEARFVATTVSKTIADRTVSADPFDTVIFDEASMAYIPQILYSASLAKKHFICMGDFAQLPPIVQCDKANNLKADIFQYCGITEAVSHGYGHEWLCMLNVQHRMHPDIASFVSDRMYHGLLESAPDMKTKSAGIVSAQPAKGKPVALVDVSGMMSVCSKTKDQSRINVLSAMLSMGLAIRAAREHDVGIITPYNAQSRLLHAMSRDLVEREEKIHKITCATVHQFQGSEKDMIIYDAVDCYRMPYPGMLLSSETNNYANRLFNVAMTRAKGKMIALVNVDYMENKKLSRNMMFRQLMDTHSTQSFRGKYILQETDHTIIRIAGDNSLDGLFMKDLNQATKEVRIDIPGTVVANSAWMQEMVTVLQKLANAGKTVIIRAESKKNLPAEIRSMAIENEYVANPIVVIDKEITWFGEPASGASFVAEGKTLPVWLRPVIRFEGKHFARAIYNFLEMNQTIDSDDQKNEKGSYDTFGAYVRGEIKCNECGKPMLLKKSSSGKFYLACSGYPQCSNKAWIEPEMVDDYLFFDGTQGKLCPADHTTLTAGKGKKNVYVSCNCGGTRHYWKLDEI